MGFPCLPENRDLSGSWFEQTFENLNGGGFPRAIWPQEAEAFSRLNFQIQPANGLNLAFIGFAEIAALNYGGHEGILLDTRNVWARTA
jgi:hypothetical protein